MKNEFWLKCARLNAVIVPFIAHTGYNADGNFDSTTKIGLKFICLEADSSAVLNSKEFYIATDEATTDFDSVADTPEEAFKIYEEYVNGK